MQASRPACIKQDAVGLGIGSCAHKGEGGMKPTDSDLREASGSKELILIRHASTDMSGSFCGQSDPPLNSIGMAQARALALLLGGWNVRRLYASDLRRAVQTAEPLSDLWNLPVAARRGFREISFGQWEGKRWSEIRAYQPDISKMELLPELCAPGGETFACFRQRVLSTLQQSVFETDRGLTAIVTHLGVIRVLVRELKPVDWVWSPQQRIEHCSVHRLRMDTDFWHDARTSEAPGKESGRT